MHHLVKKINSAISGNHLLERQRKVIVAVSGGADSVALLCALLEAGYECIAAHCNFHLRGEESMRDMRHVETLADTMGVDLRIRHFDVPVLQAEKGYSIEMACRELRYVWFDELIASEGAQAIAVAHHREDNVETFMLNLLRGTGIAGLTGMKWRNGNVIRPMLHCTRDEIEAYLREKDIDFVTDSTNLSSEFKRNRLRNEVIPFIEDKFPGAADAIVKTMSNLSEAREIYGDAITAKANIYTDGENIMLNRLADQEPHCRTILFEILRKAGFNSTHVDNIIASRHRSGAVFSSGSAVLELDRGILHISPASEARYGDKTEIPVTLDGDITYPVDIKVSRRTITGFRPRRDPYTIYLDSRACDDNRLFILRHWRKGDRISPYGMNGSKLVSDLFNDAKFSPRQKRETWLLTDGQGRILWVIGLRASRHYAIGPTTVDYIELSAAHNRTE